MALLKLLGARLSLLSRMCTTQSLLDICNPPRRSQDITLVPEVCDATNHAARITDLHKDYVLSGETVHALRGVTFDVPEGDYVSIMGPSGSGKSTLLNLLGCLDRPTRGSYLLGDVSVADMDDDELAETRATRIGFVFQSYNLLPALSVVENIEVPLYYSGRLTAEGRERCIELAKMVGLNERLEHRPAQLSGGQQQAYWKPGFKNDCRNPQSATKTK